jgi:hypothetical protein
VEQVQDYLPSNYNVVHVDPNGQGILIAGEDDHGWTMGEYVLPRLASGLIVANEVWPLFTAQGGFPASMDVPPHFLQTRLFKVKKS